MDSVTSLARDPRGADKKKTALRGGFVVLRV